MDGDPLQPIFTDEYIAFEFKDNTRGNLFDYGWFEVSQPDNSFAGLSLNIIAYAYDSTGAKIAMGATSYVPEPSPVLALTALTALSLGVVGVRRFKALQN